MASHAQLLFRDEARAKLVSGATKLAEALRPTLGPESHSVLLEKRFGSPTVCDDGMTIAKRVELADPEENLGARMMRDAAVKTGDLVGDGTTTSTILAHAVLTEGMRNVVAGTSAIGIRRGLGLGLRAAIEALAANARPVKDRADTAHVAAVSAHGDRQIGDLVADAFEKVGEEGVITVEQAQGTETTLEFVEGMQFDKGYLSPYFVNRPEQMRAELDDPLILIHEKKITTMQPLVPVLESVLQQGRPLVIIAEAVEAEALATLVVNKLRGVLEVVAVKAPGFGDRRRAMLEDIAVLTGGHLVSEELGEKLEHTSAAQLGRAHRVVVDKDSTTIVGGGGAPAEVEARRREIRDQIEASTSDWDREKLQERLAKLSGGVAIIRAGAVSEVELARSRESFDDAISAARAAIAEGIVPGGGTALLRVAAAVEAAAAAAPAGAERIGVEVLRRALEAPIRQLARNCGVDEGVVVDRVAAGEGFFGFDAATRTYGDLDAAGIIDPVKVVRVALENAVSVAGTLLLTDVTLTDVEEPQQAANPMGDAL
ncbi:MAG: chaperonin GroEL [Acidimicrobiia bacterium]|nr:chaperonin GroEL [Acidimicrobiia bacterium]